MTVEFFVPGLPRPQGSKRAFVLPGTSRTVMVESSKGLKPWRADVTHHALEARSAAGLGPLVGPVEVLAIFALPRPRSHLRAAGGLASRAPSRPCTKPDLDKLERAIGDALKGVLLADDSLIVAVEKHKVYTRDTPGVFVRVRELPAPDMTAEALLFVRRFGFGQGPDGDLRRRP